LPAELAHELAECPEERAPVEVDRRANDHALAAAQRKAGDGRLVGHAARQAKCVDDGVVFAGIVNEATAAERRPEARVVNGDDRRQAGGGVPRKVESTVAVLRKQVENAHDFRPPGKGRGD